MQKTISFVMKIIIGLGVFATLLRIYAVWLNYKYPWGCIYNDLSSIVISVSIYFLIIFVPAYVVLYLRKKFGPTIGVQILAIIVMLWSLFYLSEYILSSTQGIKINIAHRKQTCSSNIIPEFDPYNIKN